MTGILTATADGITTITIDRVSKKNSFTSEMYVAMTEALRQAADDPSVRVVVIQGDETVFSAGNDIQDFVNDPPTSIDTPVGQFLPTIAEFPKPLVAAVCGAAVGVGTTMLLHCEIVVAGENAMFMMPFVNLGITPEAGSSILLPQLIGYQRAAEALLLGGRISAADAHHMGLVNHLVPVTEVNELAQQKARELAAKPLSALIETKRLLKSGQREVLRARMIEGIEIFGGLLQQPAAKEAFSAFLEGRTPDFRKVGE